MQQVADGEMVLVIWHDAKFLPGTYGAEGIRGHHMALFKSLGYFISTDETTTVIAAENNDQDEYRDITLIPTGSIVSIEKLVPSSSM